MNAIKSREREIEHSCWVFMTSRHQWQTTKVSSNKRIDGGKWRKLSFQIKVEDQSLSMAGPPHTKFTKYTSSYDKFNLIQLLNSQHYVRKHLITSSRPDCIRVNIWFTQNDFLLWRVCKRDIIKELCINDLRTKKDYVVYMNLRNPAWTWVYRYKQEGKEASKLHFECKNLNFSVRRERILLNRLKTVSLKNVFF